VRRNATVKFRFVLRNEDPKAKPTDVKRRLNEAVNDAVKAAKQNNVAIKVKAETEGGFFGLGEMAVVLAIAHAAKAGAGLFAAGAVGAAGKSFFEDYLAPRLRKLNLLPAKLEEIPATTKPGRATKNAVQRQPAHKRTKKKSSRK